jgi:hypothetical protein
VPNDDPTPAGPVRSPGELSVQAAQLGPVDRLVDRLGCDVTLAMTLVSALSFAAFNTLVVKDAARTARNIAEHKAAFRALTCGFLVVASWSCSCRQPR